MGCSETAGFKQSAAWGDGACFAGEMKSALFVSYLIYKIII